MDEWMDVVRSGSGLLVIAMIITAHASRAGRHGMWKNDVQNFFSQVG